MRELSGLVPTAALGRLTLGLAFAVLAAACRSEGGSVGEEGFSNEGETTQLDCERLDYPCTWSEVDSAVLDRTHRVGQVAAALMMTSRDPSAVADVLSEELELAELQAGDLAVRFRLPGSRGIWVAVPYDPANPRRGVGAPERGYGEEPTAAATSSSPTFLPALSAQAQQVNHIAAKKAGSPKHALIISPFYYQIGKETKDVYKTFAANRDYRKSNGGSVTWHANLRSVGSNDPKSVRDSATLGVADQVTIDDFLNWDKYNFVYVATHGLADCPAGKSVSSGRCHTSISVREFFTDPEEGLRQGRDANRTLSAYWQLPGVEVEYKTVATDHPGLSPSEARSCLKQKSAAAMAPGGKKPCAFKEQIPIEVSVTADFFRNRYPKGLSNIVIFLAVCEALKVGDLEAHLTRTPNHDIAVFGFTKSVSDYAGAEIGKKAVELFLKPSLSNPAVKKELEKFAKRPDIGGPSFKGVVRGEKPAGSAELADRSSNPTHARDVVELVDPTTGEELEDGSRLTVVGVPNDRKPDRIKVGMRVRGIYDARDVDLINVYVKLDDREIKKPYKLSRRVEEYVFAVADEEIDLGFDVVDKEAVDLEIRAELAGGGESRWLYEDVRLGGPYWRLSFTGGEESGRYSGNAVEFRLAEDRWDGNSLSMRSQKSADPDVTIVAMMPPDFSLAPGTYPLCFSEHEYCAEILFNPVTQDPLAQDWAGYVTGDGVTVDYPYDGNDMGPAFRYPPPATLTITRVADDIIEGRIEGQLFKEVYTQKSVGHARHFVTASATIEFAAKRLKGP